MRPIHPADLGREKDSFCPGHPLSITLMLHIIWSIIVGFIVGLCARAILPGVQHLGFIMTTLLGIGGSIIGGLIGPLLFPPTPGSSLPPAGFLISILGALFLLLALGKG